MKVGSAAHGFVLVTALLLVMAMALLWLAANARSSVARLAETQQRQRERALADAADAMQQWYRAHLADLDRPDSPLGTPAAQQWVDGLALPVPVRAALSEPAAAGAAAGRIVQLWSPLVAAVDGSRFDVTAGAFVAAPGTLARRVDGRLLEQDAVGEARATLRSLAAVLEAWFSARVAADPEHRLDRNHFLPADGCRPGSAALPCLERLTGQALDARFQRLPWGPDYPIEIASDGQDAPPFRLALRLRTPWGMLLQVQALAPAS